MSVAVRPVEPASPLFDAAIDFLKTREWRAASLASHLAADGKPSYPGKHIADFACLVDSAESAASAPAQGAPLNVEGVLVRTASGILLHCFPDSLDLSRAKGALAAFLARGTVRCVLGPARETRFLASLLPEPPYQSVDYQLMSLASIPNVALETLPGGLEIAPARLDEVDAILPLQEGYEKEEVIPPGDVFDRAACKANLARAIEKQKVYLVRAQGRPVAKAGTNARAFACDQLGGVYTAPEWRNKGLATALVAKLSRELAADGRKVVLFVKTGNMPAKKAYEKVGFTPESAFAITYF